MPIQKGPANLGTGVIDAAELASGSVTTAKLATDLVVTHALGSASTPSITFTGDTNTGIFSPAADTIAFTEGGVEAMRIDSSGNVGIGTGSPAYKLTVDHTSGLGFAVTRSAKYIGINANAAGSNTYSYIETDTGMALAFNTNGANERMRITSDGNAGIGTTSPTTYVGYTTLSLNNATNGGVYDILKNDTRVAAFFSSDVTTTLASITSIPLVFRTANTERMRINAGAPILCLAGGNTSATGTGIAFPATQSASSDANTLDDYEEGTWTATYTAGTMMAQTCTYTKIGRMVTVNFQVQWTANSTSLGTIGGLPFNIASINYMATHTREWYNTGKTTQCIGSVGSATMDLFWYDNTRVASNGSIYGVSGTIVYNVS